MKDEIILPGRFEVLITTYELAIIEKATLRKFQVRPSRLLLVSARAFATR